MWRRLRISRASIALLLSPLALILVSAVRVLIISNYNITTAATIVTSGGYVNTLLGTAISLVPIFMPYLALIMLYIRRYVVSVLTLLASALVAPMQISPMTAFKYMRYDWNSIWAAAHVQPALSLSTAIVIILDILYRLAETYDKADVLHIVVSVVASIFLIPYLLYVYPIPHSRQDWDLLLRQPWLPATKVVLSSGEAVNGYVLSTSNSWFVVLLGNGRTIDYIPAGHVMEQFSCQVTEYGEGREQPLIPLIARPTVSVPNCPSQDITQAPTSQRSS